jgi:hypothetical protein
MATRYFESAGTYHTWNRCPRAHATGDRIREVESTDGLDACSACVDDADPSGTCDVVKSDGEVCGRDRPCSYHDD